MNYERSHTVSPFSTTPPNQQIALPPTPPGTVERQPSSTVESVQDLKRHWRETALAKRKEADEIVSFKIGKEFDPHRHLGEIGDIFRRFDCYPASLRVRMPSPIHELVIAGLEREYTVKQFQRGGRYTNVKLGRSSRIFLDAGGESRQPDIQFRLGSNPIPGIVIEVAHTQTEKELQALADDYILKTDGRIRRVYGINLNPLGRSSTISEWRAKITASDDPEYDEEVRVEKMLRKEFRAADGSCVNSGECLVIPLSDFGIDTDELDEPDEKGIAISFQTVFNSFMEALQMETRNETEGEGRPAKRVKRIGRTPSPIEQLQSDDEAKFRAAEEATEQKNHQSDFEPPTDDEEASDSSEH